MATNKSDLSSKSSGSVDSPIDNERSTFVTENPSTKITKVLFNEENYLSWLQSATLWLHSESKFGYLDGTIKASSTNDPDDPAYAKWKVDNYLIMSWLVHSMEPEIADNYLSMDTAQDIWDTLAQTFPEGECSPGV